MLKSTKKRPKNGPKRPRNRRTLKVYCRFTWGAPAALAKAACGATIFAISPAGPTDCPLAIRVFFAISTLIGWEQCPVILRWRQGGTAFYETTVEYRSWRTGKQGVSRRTERERGRDRERKKKRERPLGAVRCCSVDKMIAMILSRNIAGNIDTCLNSHLSFSY